MLFRLQDLLSAARPVKPAEVSSTAILIQTWGREEKEELNQNAKSFSRAHEACCNFQRCFSAGCWVKKGARLVAGSDFSGFVSLLWFVLFPVNLSGTCSTFRIKGLLLLISSEQIVLASIWHATDRFCISSGMNFQNRLSSTVIRSLI